MIEHGGSFQKSDADGFPEDHTIEERMRNLRGGDSFDTLEDIGQDVYDLEHDEEHAMEDLHESEGPGEEKTSERIAVQKTTEIDTEKTVDNVEVVFVAEEEVPAEKTVDNVEVVAVTEEPEVDTEKTVDNVEVVAVTKKPEVDTEKTVDNVQVVPVVPERTAPEIEISRDTNVSRKKRSLMPDMHDSTDGQQFKSSDDTVLDRESAPEKPSFGLVKPPEVGAVTISFVPRFNIAAIKSVSRSFTSPSARGVVSSVKETKDVVGEAPSAQGVDVDEPIAESISWTPSHALAIAHAVDTAEVTKEEEARTNGEGRAAREATAQASATAVNLTQTSAVTKSSGTFKGE